MKLIISISLLVGIVVCQNQYQYRPSIFSRPATFSSSPSVFSNNRPSTFNNRPQSGRYQPLRTTTYRPFVGSQYSGQYNAGQYKSNNRRVTDNSGRYNPAGDGKYKPSGDGRYQHRDEGKYSYTDASGRYKDSGHGKYINGKYVDGPYVDGKYIGDTSGYYVDSSVPYDHKDIGGGKYTGQNVPYDPYKDKQYPGGAYQGDNSGDKYKGTNTPNRANTPSGVNTPSRVNTPSSVNTPNSGSKSDSPVAKPAFVYRPSNGGIPIPAVDPKLVDAEGKSTLGVPQGLEKDNAAGLYSRYNYSIIVNNKEIDPKGDYHYMYETENRIFGEEFSKVVSETEEQKDGYFKYTGPDSNVYVVTYKAGVDGFVPQGKHIPTEPPIPELIQRALDYKREKGLI